MKILVAVKRVIDPYVQVRVRSDGSGVETNNVKMSMNPFDEVAVEGGIRMKEAGQASELIAVTAGPAKSAETLRTAIAMGADRGIQVLTETPPEPLAVAKLLAAIARRESPGLILLGKQAIDDDCNQTAQMLAALLDRPQGTFVSRIARDGDRAEVTREVDGGLETVSFALPAVISVDLRLGEPRYATLPAIMKAKRAPLETLSPEDLGVDASPRLSTLEVTAPPARPAGVVLESVAELVARLRGEAGAIP